MEARYLLLQALYLRGLPIKYVGAGEKLADIAPFDPVQFFDALFEAE
jgi:signal recognition particle GTPase